MPPVGSRRQIDPNRFESSHRALISGLHVSPWRTSFFVLPLSVSLSETISMMGVTWRVIDVMFVSSAH